MKPLTTSYRINLRATTHYAAMFALAMILMVVQLPDHLLLYRPDFVAIVLIYLCWYHPDSIGVLTAFIAGLLFDVLTFGVLGQHALAKVIVAYCCIRFSPRLKNAPLVGQTVFVLALLFVNSIVIMLVRLYTNEGGGVLVLWLAPLVGAILWYIFSIVKQILSSVRNVTAN